jgi:hypothetical protein
MTTGQIDVCVWCGRSRVVKYHEWTSPKSGFQMSGFVCPHCLDPQENDNCRTCKARENLRKAREAAANYPLAKPSEHHRERFLKAVGAHGEARRLAICATRRAQRCEHGWRNGIHP